MTSKDDLLPPRIGRYEVVDRIGEGATSQVLLGRDPTTGQEVAIKIFANQPAQAEWENLRSLDHPAIPKIVDDILEWEGCQCLVTEYIQGTSLSTLIGEKQDFSQSRILSLVAEVANALQYVHENRVMHLDIKPSNLLIRPDGRVVIVDFGSSVDIATLMHDPERRFGGSPLYASPELCRGEIDAFSARPDIFSLGAVLYEMLVGHTPYSDTKGAAKGKHLDTESHGKLWAAAAEKYDGKSGPTPVDTFDQSIPDSIRMICNQALRIDPGERFATMAEFAEALRRTEVQLSKRLRDPRFSRRTQAITFAVSSILIAFALGAWWMNGHSPENSTVRLPSASTVASSPSLSEPPSQSGTPTGVELDSNPASNVPRIAQIKFPDHPERIDVQYSLDTVAPRSTISTAAWSPDGLTIAYGTFDGDLRLCSGKSLETLHSLRGHRGVVLAVDWKTDGRRLVSSGFDGKILLWDMSGGLLKTIQRSGPVVHIEWQPHGDRFVTLENSGTEGIDKGRAVIWDSSGHEITSFSVDKYYGTQMAWDSLGRRLASTGGESKVKFWTSDGTPDGELSESPTGTHSIDWSFQGTVVTTGGSAKMVGLRMPGSDRWSEVSLASGTGVAARWSPDGHSLLTLTSKGLFLGRFGEDAGATESLVRETTIAFDLARTLAWHPDGDRFLIGGEALTIWRVKDFNQLIVEIEQSQDKADLVSISAVSRPPKGELFAVATNDGRLGLFDSRGHLQISMIGHSGNIHTLSWSKDGEWLASGGQDKTLRYWTRNGEPGRSVDVFDSPITHVAWSNTDQWLVAGTDDKYGCLHHPVQGRGASLENQSSIFSINWSRKDERIAFGLSGVVGIQFWDRDSQFREWKLLPGGARTGLRDHVVALEYSPVGDRFAAGSNYGRAVIVDHHEKTTIPLLSDGPDSDWFHSGSVVKVKWNNHGDRLVTAATDGRIGLWSANGEPIGTWVVESTPVSLAWSPDDQWLAAGDKAGGLWIWNTKSNTTQSLMDNLTGITTISWDYDSRHLMLGTAGGVLRVVDALEGKVVSTSIFRPGNKIVSLSEDGNPSDAEQKDLLRDIRILRVSEEK